MVGGDCIPCLRAGAGMGVESAVGGGEEGEKKRRRRFTVEAKSGAEEAGSLARYLIEGPGRTGIRARHWRDAKLQLRW